MTRTLKFLLISGPFLTSLVYAATSPVIHVYFIRLIGPDILAMANVISSGLAAAVNGTISSDRMKKLYRKHFHWIITLDVVCFTIISFEGLAIPEVRFLGFALLDAVSTTLWCAIMKDAVNHTLKGDGLTNFESFMKSMSLFASCAGGLFAVFYVDLNVEYCIWAQCIVNATMGALDWVAYKRLGGGKYDTKGRPCFG